MNKKLYAPLLTLGLAVSVLAACEQKADAAAAPIAVNTVTVKSKPAKTESAKAQISGNSAAANIISEADAKKIALEHAGVQEADASYLKVKLDYDDRVLEYEVEFYVGTTEYDFDIDAVTGAIRSFDYEIDDDHETNVSGNFAPSAPSQGVSEADARKTALAKVPGASDSDIRDFEADMEDGRLVYEGEIRYNGMEYEFEIDAATGAIISWDAEYDD